MKLVILYDTAEKKGLERGGGENWKFGKHDKVLIERVGNGETCGFG